MLIPEVNGIIADRSGSNVDACRALTRAMRTLTPGMTGLVAGLFLCSLASAQQGAAGTNLNPFDGQWTVSFTVSSPPGGYQMTSEGGGKIWGDLQYQLEKRFTVAQDGVIGFEGADSGSFFHDQNVTFPGMPGIAHYRWVQQPLCRVHGTATATPNPPEAELPYTRTLKLDIQWAAGNGTELFETHLGTFAGSMTASADGNQITAERPYGLPPFTQPLAYWSSQWDLKTAENTLEETSPDVVKERARYEGTRRMALEPATGKGTGVERIEVLHVRQLNLVPRDDQ